MTTTLTKAQAEAILDTATKLFDLVVEARQIAEGSPEAQEIYTRIVHGALGDAAPTATVKDILTLLGARGLYD
ncbi:hypothetical protein [Paraburkholderia bannensis]|uniref:hypothetical protein n=1 Tax=Paraburkholderia bannensis TaxID=765414 RepID=UPI0012EC52EF|nr:hypothetical protein [Paraburkholderia bannensis]